MNTTAEQGSPGPHLNLRRLPLGLGPPADPGRLQTNLTFVSEHIFIGF